MDGPLYLPSVPPGLGISYHRGARPLIPMGGSPLWEISAAVHRTVLVFVFVSRAWRED